jgi:hypothetical protein
MCLITAASEILQPRNLDYGELNTFFLEMFSFSPIFMKLISDDEDISLAIFKNAFRKKWKFLDSVLSVLQYKHSLTPHHNYSSV